MSAVTHALRCRCGALQGQVTLNGSSNRMVCCCRDCQAFALFLAPADQVLDAQGGSDVVQIAPDRIRFTQGEQHLAVMRLSDKGMLRWYAACCRTPVGNTLNGPSVPFTGLLAQCLDTAPLEPAFGPVRARVNTASALGEPKPKAFGMGSSLLRILFMVLGCRLTGRHKNTPFFDAAGQPVAVPTVLSAAERARLQPAPGNA